MARGLGAVRVDGLADFNRALKRMDAGLPKELRLALNEAADTIIDATVPRVPKRTGRAAKSLKARSTRTAARVAGGGSKAPYYPWLDFGGKVGRNKATQRRFFRFGRYLYKRYFDLKDSGEFVKVLTDALHRVTRKAGLHMDVVRRG